MFDGLVNETENYFCGAGRVLGDEGISRGVERNREKPKSRKGGEALRSQIQEETKRKRPSRKRLASSRSACVIRKIPWVLSSLARPLLNAFTSSSPVLICPFPLRGCEDRLALLTCQLCIWRGMVLLMFLDAFFAVSNFSISGWLRLRVWYRMPRCGGLPRRERALLISFRALIERGVEPGCLCLLIVRYDR